MRYALFLGCTIPVRGQHYELSARKVAERLGVELVDVPGMDCCGFPVKSVSWEASLVFSAKNLALAEREGLPLCSLCNACTVTLVEANHILKHDPELLEKVNSYLARLDLKYNGTVEVKHFARILYEDVGLERIKESVVKPLEGISVASHYGCHYLKPSEIYDHFDNPEHPYTLDELVELSGASAMDYSTKTLCCGGAILGVREDIALKMTKKKLDEVKGKGADALISICPFCSVMYEGNQKKIEKNFEVTYKLPVLYYPQLLGLALGISPDELGFKLNRVKAKDLLAKVSDEQGTAE